MMLLRSYVYSLEKDFKNDMLEGQKAVELNPNSVKAHLAYGLVLRSDEYVDEVIQNINRAIRLSMAHIMNPPDR
jgi:tetratricopeptide (TPR) repeat protein